MVKQAQKKEFSWDTETVIKTIEVNAFEKRVISITSLNGNEYVCIATHKKIKDAWKPVKNSTVPKAIWGDIVDAVGDFDLKEAFGSTTNLQAPGKKGKAKKEAKAPVAKLQGIKTAIDDKLKLNPNWATLSKFDQAKLAEQVKEAHDEFGMVTVGITKTASYFVTSGVSQQAGEFTIRKTKGFARAQMTFIA